MKYSVRIEGLVMPNRILEMIQWCKENVQFSLEDVATWDGTAQEPWRVEYAVFYFANEKYATLFALRWL